MRKISKTNIITSYVVLICFFASFITAIPVNASAADENEPKKCIECNKEAIEISSYEDLNKIRENLSGCFILTDDIDCEGKEFTPIEGSFTGHFDGNNHKVLNLKINGSEKVGFFSSISSGTVENFAIEDAKIKATGSDVGILVGVAENAKISNCYVKGEIEGLSRIGGISGSGISKTTYTNCYSYLSKITSKSNEYDVAGISGGNDSTIKAINCYTISDGQKSPICGSIDYDNDKLTEENFENCYYNEEFEKNKFTEFADFGIKDSQMTNKDTYKSWDFDNVWQIDNTKNSGYPYLKSFLEKGNSLEITPGNVVVTKGHEQNFNLQLKINGKVVLPTETKWSIEGNTSTDTNIDKNGKFTLGLNETGDVVTVKAVATFKSSSGKESVVKGYSNVFISNIKDADTPKFGLNSSQEVSYKIGDNNPEPLKANGSVNDGGTLSYQWYINNVNSNENGQPINNAIGDTYIPDLDVAGTYYYYVIVTNNNESSEITGAHMIQKASSVYTVKVADNHKVIYDANGGTLSDSAVKSFNELDSDIALENPTRDGYDFDGWYTDKNFVSDKVTSIKKGTSEDVYLFAKWAQKGQTPEKDEGAHKDFINISFDINGAIGNTPENITVKNGESVKLPVILNAVKPGFIFNGWTYEDGKLADNIIKCEGKDIKLVASWKKVSADVSIDEINSEYSNVSEVVGKINVKSSETVSVKVNVIKDGKDYTNFVYNKDSNTITIKTEGFGIRDNYKVTAEVYYEGNKLDSNTVSFAVNYIKDIETRYEGKVTDTININNDKTVQEALSLNANSEEFYKAISNLSLSRAITINDGISNGEYIVSTSDSSVALVSEKPSNDINLGNKEITTREKEVYINGLKDGSCTITITHKQSGVTKKINVNVNSLSERLYVVNPKYTDGFNSYVKLNDNYLMRLARQLANRADSTYKDDSTDISKLNWTFKADNDINGVKLVKLSNGDIILYNPSQKFTGTLYSRVTSFDIPISEKVDDMVTGEDLRGKSYPKNALGINGTYKANLKLMPQSNNSSTSSVNINAYVLKNNQVVEHIKKDYYGDLTNEPDISFGFNTDKIGKVSSKDTLEVVYEISGDSYMPMYIRNTILKDLKLRDSKSIAELSKVGYTGNSYTAIFRELNNNIESEETKQYISLTDHNKEENIRVYTASKDSLDQSSTEISIGSKKCDDSNRQNITYEGMKYTWYVHNIKLNEKSVESGTTNNIKIKLMDNQGKLAKLMSSNFKVSSSINIPDPELQSNFKFFGGISGGEISTKATGKFKFTADLPTSINADFQVESTENTLSRTFVALLGYSGEYKGDKKDDKKDEKKDESFKKTLNKEMKKIKEKKANKKGGKAEYSISGYMMGTLNYVNGKWVYSVSGGGLSGSLGASYGITNNVFVGPVPVYFGFKVGIEIDADVLVAGKNSYHDLFNVDDYNLVLDGMIGVAGKVVVEGGIGFDAKVLAIKFGAEGELKLSYNHRGVLFTNKNVGFNGGETTLSGSLRLAFQAKILFFKTRVVLASGSLSKTWANGYNFPPGRPNDFLSNEGDNLDVSGSTIIPLSFAGSSGINSDDWTSNIYPYATPISSKDGKSMGLLYNDGDMDDPKSIKPAISYNNDGNYSEPEVITGWDEEKNIVSSMDYDGNSNIQVLAFDATKYEDTNSNDMESIENAMNNSEIYVTTVIDGKMVTKNLTNDTMADCAPVVYTNGNKAVVLWQKGNYHINKDSNDNYIGSGYENGDTLWYATFDGDEWSEPKMIEDGSIGSTQAYDVAIMEDGTIMAVTSRANNSDDDLNTRQIVAYTIKDGETIREQLTNDNLPETQPRVTVYNNNGKDAFAIGYIKAEDSVKAKNGEDSEIPDVSNRLIVKGYDENGNAISTLDCQSEKDSVNEKYDFIKSESKDLGISWVGYDYNGNCTAYSKVINIDKDSSSLSKTYTIDTLENGTSINNLSSYMKNNDDGNAVVTANILGQKVSDEGENGIEEKPAFITNKSVTITDNIEDVSITQVSDNIYPNETIDCNISFKNSCSDTIKALIVEDNNQVQTINVDLDSGKDGSVNYTYKIGDEVKDVDIKITPILSDGSTGKTVTSTLKLYLPNLFITDPTIIKKQSGGIYTLNSYIANFGEMLLEDDDYVIVKIVENNDKVSKVEANSDGATVLDDGTIKISGKEAIKALNEDFYNLTFNHKVEKDSYNKNGVKPMHIYVEAYNKDDEKYDDIMLTYSEASFDFVKPSLTEGEQFRYDIEQNNDLQYTSAKITITNNYEESGEGNFKISLLDNDSNVIESKIVKMSFDSQEAKEFNVEFDKVGKEIVISETQEEPTEPVTPKPVEPEPIVNPGDNNNSGIYNINSTNSRRNNLDNNSNSKSTSKETGNSIPVGLLLFNITSISVIAIFGLKKLRTKNNKGIK